jgi:hypothetical protein
MRARGWVGVELERREHSALLGTNSSLVLNFFDILDKKKEKENLKLRLTRRAYQKTKHTLLSQKKENIHLVKRTCTKTGNNPRREGCAHCWIYLQFSELNQSNK